MPAEPCLVDAPEILWRLERATTPLRFSRISPVDAENDRAGNRFDVPGGGVLYAAADGFSARSDVGRTALLINLSTTERSDKVIIAVALQWVFGGMIVDISGMYA